MIRARRILGAVVASATLLVGTTGVHPAAAVTAATPLPHDGYILMGADGGIFNWNLPFNGAPAGSPGACAPANGILQSPVAGGSCLAIALTPSGNGYWILDSTNGAVYPNGDAGLLSDPNDREPSQRLSGVSQEFWPQLRQIVSTPSGNGYWVYEVEASDTGAVDAFGDAGSYGSTAKLLVSHAVGGFNGSPVAMAATPDGKGYWEVYSDGGVFAFGDAHFYGSMSGRALAQNIVGITATADGKGYWLVAADGGVFAFGDAHYAGSAVGIGGRGPIVGMTRNPAGTGYWLTSSDGGVYSFGGAQFFGSVPQFGITPNAPIVAIVARSS
jgi:hypothetical protein